MKVTAILMGLCLSLSVFAQTGDWTIVNEDLPLNKTFESGTRVVVKIDYDSHTTVDYINESDSAVTVVFHVSHDGKPLPDEKIGPVRYRTKDLDPGETIQMTFSWDKGHEVAFDISGGSLHLKAGPKKRST